MRPAPLRAAAITATVVVSSATLAAAAIGKDIGLLDGNFFNAIIILSIVTTLPVPSMVRLILEYNRKSFETPADYPVPGVVQEDGLL